MSKGDANELDTGGQVTGPAKPHRLGILLGVSLFVCLLALVVEFVLTLLSTNNPWALGLGDVVILLFILGPYLALAAIAWTVRRRRVFAWVTLVVILVLSVWGLSVAGTHTYYYLTDLEFRMIQPIGIFLMPLGQWFVVVCLATSVGLNALRFT